MTLAIASQRPRVPVHLPATILHFARCYSSAKMFPSKPASPFFQAVLFATLPEPSGNPSKQFIIQAVQKVDSFRRRLAHTLNSLSNPDNRILPEKARISLQAVENKCNL